MAAHRFWRIYITAVQSSTIAQIAEVGLYKSTDCSNRCILDPANASASTYGASVPSNCVDGQVATYWASSSGGIPAFWGYAFPEGAAADVVGFSMSPSQNSTAAVPKDFTLQYSDDGSSWTTLLTVVGNTILTGALFYGCYPLAEIVGEPASPLPSYSGTYKITGAVNKLGVPGAYRTRLCLKDPPVLIEEKWSNASGVVVYENLANNPSLFILEAYDHTSSDPVAAAISDQLILESM